MGGKSVDLKTADVVHAVWSDASSPTSHGMLVVRGIEHLIRVEESGPETLRCAVVTVPNQGAAISMALEMGNSVDGGA